MLETDLHECAQKRANKEQILERFAKMRNNLDRIEDKVVNITVGLSPREQDEVISFWEEVADFLSNIVEWIFKKFIELVKLIIKGVILVI